MLNLFTSPKKEKRVQRKKVDSMSEQVKKILETEDQKLILMVRV